MTENELLDALKRLGLSQSGAARLLDYNPRTVRRWVSGMAEIPWVIHLLFWLIRKYKVKPEELLQEQRREEDLRLTDEAEVAKMMEDGPVAFTRRRPPEH